MQLQTLLADNYLADGECFHLAERVISKGSPNAVHDHDYYELFWLDSGQLLHHINGARQKLAKGALVFIRPSDRHALQAQGNDTCIITNVMFRVSSAEHLIGRYALTFEQRFFWQPGLLPEVVELSDSQLWLIQQLHRQLMLKPPLLAAIEGFLLSILSELSTAEVTAKTALPPWLARALRRMYEPDVFRQGASGFVSATERSHEHVCRIVKQYLDSTPTQLVNRVRMEFAARQLTSTDKPIEQVADDCGFDNHSYFYRLFQRHSGLTPRRYRQQKTRDPVTPNWP